MRSSWLALLAPFAVTLAAPGLAHAHEGGCFVDGECVALPEQPCDSSCSTSFCVDERCADADCIPCDVGGACPVLRIANQVLEVFGSSEGECRYELCAGVIVVADSSHAFLSRVDGTIPACFETLEPAALVEGDCDADGIVNRIEGDGQICTPQSYVVEGDLADGCTLGEGCAATAGLCEDFGAGLLGGYVCDAAATWAYGCVDGDPSTCPGSDPLVPVGCVRDGTACAYIDDCELAGTDAFEGCYDVTVEPNSALPWIDSAWLAGDCDGDGRTNGDEGYPAECERAGEDDAGASDEDASVAREDAGSVGAIDAASIDAASIDGSVSTLRFQGSGCSCRAAGSAGSHGPGALAGLALALGLVARRVSASRRRSAVARRSGPAT